jgi:tripartite-type tricarboxylate transporter receptor subunit TctC
VLRALAAPELQEKFRALDITMVLTPGAEARSRIKSDLQKWAKVVEAAGMRVD